MRRDFDLVRQLLLFFEQEPDRKPEGKPIIEGYDENTIQYHVVLLFEAGLLRGEPVRSTTSDRLISVLPFELTWRGHEFLQQVREDSTWMKVKTIAQSKGVSLGFGITSQIAIKVALEAINR